MRHSIHQLRPGVEFHLFTNPDLKVEPRGELVASDGKKVSRKDKLLPLCARNPTTILKKGTEMPAFCYQLRPGVELAVEVRVSLRRDLENPTPEMMENMASDNKSARFTVEYMEAHARRAIRSFEESRLLPIILSKTELSQEHYKIFQKMLCARPTAQDDEEFLAEFFAEISS